MRRRLSLMAALALLITTAARVLTNTPFAGDDAYATLQLLATSIPEPYIYTAATALALAALTLFSYYTQTRDIPEEALLIIALSPAFLTAAITNAHALLLATASMALLVTNKTWAGPLFAGVLGLIHPAGALPALIYISTEIVRKHQLRAITATLLSALALTQTPATITYAMRIAELQALGATSALTLLLATTGALLLWDENTYPWLLAALTTAFAGLALPELRLVAAFAAAIPAGHALRILRKRRWALETIKSSALLFVLLGLFFTAVSASSTAIQAPPLPDTAETASIAHELAGEQAVFTISDQQHALQWYGVNTTDEHQARIESLRDADELKKYTTEFIILNKDAHAPNLRFVLTNSNDYVLLYRNGHEIWREV